jgi:hypothetical protein
MSYPASTLCQQKAELKVLSGIHFSYTPHHCDTGLCVLMGFWLICPSIEPKPLTGWGLMGWFCGC